MTYNVLPHSLRFKNDKDIIFEGIKRYAPQRILSKNLDPEYYNKEVKRLKVKVRKMYNKRKIGQLYQRELKRLSTELLVAKKKAQETFLRVCGLRERRQVLDRILQVR
jgi:hypothetical protein